MTHIKRYIVDWTTGDPEGDRITVLSAYRDFLKEAKQMALDYDNDGITDMLKLFDKWSIDTENQIDDIPRIWIKRPTKI